MTTSCGFENQPDLLVAYGPTLRVQVGFDGRFTPGSGMRPELPPDQYQALVDTGAAATCIDADLAARLGLPVVNQQRVASPLGAGNLYIHLAQLILPGMDSPFYGEFLGAHLAAGRQPHSILIGRDFLRHFIMSYNGITGAVTIAGG